MGSPVSPSVANMVMEHIEESVLKECRIKPPFFYRYVDDIVTAVPKDKVDEFVNSFNNFDAHIKFTVEIEKDGHLPFLDTVMYRKPDGSIETDWYHKETWSGRYLNFDSCLPMSYKRNTVSLLSEKIIKLSDKRFHRKNFNLLTETLVKNGYPLKLINRTKQSVINKHQRNINCDTRNAVIPDPDLRQKYVSIPYTKHLFERVKHTLAPYNIKVVGRADDNLGRSVFTSLKDKTPKELRSNVIYQADCDCGAKYIGQTSQTLKTRAYQHTYESKKKSTTESTSALSSHIRECNNNITTENFKILDSEANSNKRKVLEMIHIKKTKNTINKQTDTDYLRNTYDNLICV